MSSCRMLMCLYLIMKKCGVLVLDSSGNGTVTLDVHCMDIQAFILNQTDQAATRVLWAKLWVQPLIQAYSKLNVCHSITCFDSESSVPNEAITSALAIQLWSWIYLSEKFQLQSAKGMLKRSTPESLHWLLRGDAAHITYTVCTMKQQYHVGA